MARLWQYFAVAAALMDGRRGRRPGSEPGLTLVRRWMSMRGRMRLAAPCLVVAVAMLGGGEALARGEDKSWEFGAYTFFSRHTNESLIDEGFGFGLRGAYYLRAAHAIELSVDNVGPDATVDGFEFDVTKVALSYVHNYAPKGNQQISPYLTFGTGLLTAEVTGMGGSFEDSSTLIQVGGGLRYFFKGKPVALRFEGRASHWRGEGVATPREGYFTFDVAAGVSFLWKGGK